MPLYEYQCESCGNRFERIQKFSDPPVESCPSCSGPVRKLLSTPAIQFKGSGWYITDYARKGSGDGGGSTEPKDSGKKDSAGAAKTDSPSTPATNTSSATTKSD